MAIKRVTLNTLNYLVNEIKSRYVEKAQIGKLASLDEISLVNLAEDLKTVINGKADTATTLVGYGITDSMTEKEIVQAISKAIAKADHLERVIVESVRDIDVKSEDAEKSIFMVPNTDKNNENAYNEYMVVNGKLEKVGDWKVDLSDYVTTQQAAEVIKKALASYSKIENVKLAINEAVTGLIKLSDLSANTTGQGNVITELKYNASTGKFSAEKGLSALTAADLVEITEQEVNALFS